MSIDIEQVMKASITLEAIFAPMNRDRCSKCDWNNIAADKYPLVNRGCCSACSGNRGFYGSDIITAQLGNPEMISSYLSRSGSITNQDVYKPLFNAAIDKIKSHYWWDDIYGFFNPANHKCNLPRYMRSSVCLYTHCAECDDELIHECISTIIQYRRENKDWFEKLRSQTSHGSIDHV